MNEDYLPKDQMKIYVFSSSIKLVDLIRSHQQYLHDRLSIPLGVRLSILRSHAVHVPGHHACAVRYIEVSLKPQLFLYLDQLGEINVE